MSIEILWSFRALRGNADSWRNAPKSPESFPADSAYSSRALITAVGRNYFDTFNTHVLAGRVFEPDRDRCSPSLRGGPIAAAPVVIDARMASTLGFENPRSAVGRTVYASGGVDAPAAPIGEILGVVEADISRLRDEFSGTIFQFDPDHKLANRPAVRIDPNDIPGALAHIERTWNAFAQLAPARMRFSEELFEAAYMPFGAIASAFAALAACAFAISTAGVLGMAVHAIARRRREIGVRKTLGSSVVNIMRLLLIDFSMPVLVGNLLAWPLGDYAAQIYLSAFAHRIELTPAPFLISMLITLTIAWAAVIGVVLKAASVRPAEVLRQA